MALAAVVASATPACATVVETVKRAPYAVTGSTEAEVRADIDAKRPGSYDAKANWYFRWHYTYRTDASGCSMARVSVALELTLVEPALRSPDASVQKSFDDYLIKLRAHEDGHADLARATARRIDAALQPLTAATCNALGQRANEIGQTIVREGNAEQVAYDARTDHGATQGARWPPATVSTAPAPGARGSPDRSQYQTSDPPPARPSSD